MLVIRFLFLVFPFHLISATATADEDFLGCGGFLQVEKRVGLDLSKVEIRLYTKQGNLKYHTDCAPNNGYYFIPVYDKGEYVIKVISPEGWSFEPSSVSINVDKETDQCTLGKDINFVFQGFSITSKVVSRGRTTGPAGVTIQLFSDHSDSPLQVITSEKNGLFSFNNILPGHYRIQAGHPSWKFSTSELDVNLQSNSFTLNDDTSGLIEILGYEVDGYVSSDREPIQGVIFSLYSQGQDASYHCGLSAPSVASPISVSGDWRLICQAVSDTKGLFNFPVVSPGRYKMVPLYQGENIRFDILPNAVDFEVEDGSLTIPQKFEVQGFRVSGRVLEHANGNGVVGAKIFLNDKLVTVTGEGGSYNLENIKTGTYRLTAEAEEMGFDRLSVRISPTAPSLPDMVASTYLVCGQIQMTDLPASLIQTARQAIFIPADSKMEPVLVSADSAGKFCQLLKPGQYKLEPMALETEVAAGLKFVPSAHHIHLEQKTISGFSFNQLRASISGRVNAIESSAKVPIRLTSISQPLRMAQPIDMTTSDDGSFVFPHLLPGKYKLSVAREDWCWRNKNVELEITDGDKTDVIVDQIGFFLSVSSSHDVDVIYTLDSNGQQLSDVLKIRAGSSKHCLSSPGRYILKPRSCHVFDPSSIEWSTDKPALVQLKSVRHRVGVVVRSDEQVPDLQVTATSSIGEKMLLTLDGISSVANGGFEHNFIFDAPSGETLELTAQAESLLFFPSTQSLTISKDCDDRAATIVAQRGLYITGSVSPAIQDVQITITGGHLVEPATVLTDVDGRYTYGPVNLDGHPILDMASTFKLAAEKRGYILTPARVFGNFVAEKLAEISILVVDHATDQPLPSVLVATAGGVGYRLNSQTGADGRVTLSGLNPGEYFIKPVLKEYRFVPSSKLVEIQDGATVEVSIKGERVAFSYYGTVTALNGEPEPSVGIEAIGSGSPQCTEYHEETNSESNGQFRLRGLVPQCEYTVQMKKGSGNIERTLPANHHIKMDSSDVTGLRFAVIKSINQADVVVTVHSEPEHIKTIKLNLYRDDQPDVVLNTIKLDTSPLIFLPVLPMDGRKYYLQLESSLGRHGYDFQTPGVSFTTNQSVQHLSLRFEPKRKSIEATETTQVSVRSVLFILFCLVSCYYYQSLVPLLGRLLVVTTNAMKPNKTSGSSGYGTYQSSGGSSSNPNHAIFSEQELALMESSGSNEAARKRVKPRRAQ